MNDPVRILVSPAQAAEWLSDAQNYRTLNAKFVARIVSDLVTDSYLDRGDPIRISKAGKCVDGQHRLTAIVESGVSVGLTVILGYEGDILLIDDPHQHHHRTVSDALKREGAVSVSTLAALVRRDLMWSLGPNLPSAMGVRFSIPKIVAHYRSNPTVFADAVRAVKAASAICPPAVAGSCWLQFVRHDRPLAGQFFDILGTRDSSGLVDGDPMIRLLKRFVDDSLMRHRRVDPMLQTCLIVKTWNAWREGNQPRNLAWRRSGPQAEPFPEII